MEEFDTLVPNSMDFSGKQSKKQWVIKENDLKKNQCLVHSVQQPPEQKSERPAKIIMYPKVSDLS